MSEELLYANIPQARIREALERDEFVLYCQPILALSGAQQYPMWEVLVRMREEEDALLPPGYFLPVLEHYRMMPQLDRWVVRQVLKRLAADSRLPRLTVNISSQTVMDMEFPKFIAAELKTRRVAASSLVLEIDESDTLSAAAAVTRFAAAVKSVGCGLLVDGFGARSVAFTSLLAMRADFIKVDGSIVRRLLTSDMARSNMDTIIRVGKKSGIGVVAECVEDQDILARLKGLGVGYAQGLGICIPRPIDAAAT